MGCSSFTIAGIINTDIIWASTRETLSSGICEQHRRRPACASAQSDQRLFFAFWKVSYVNLLQVKPNNLVLSEKKYPRKKITHQAFLHFSDMEKGIFSYNAINPHMPNFFFVGHR